MRERGRYQIQLMKTRSSGGVGSKIDLAFDIDTLRISDLDEDQEVSDSAVHTADALTSAIKKRTSTVSNKSENVAVVEKVERSVALKDMLKTQKSVFDDDNDE